MKKLLILFFIAAFVGIGSCKKDDKDSDICSGTWTTQVNDELTAAVNAAMAYANSATVANCNAYKTAMQNYINALRPYENCTLWAAQDRASFQAALDDAEEDLAGLTCQ